MAASTCIRSVTSAIDGFRQSGATGGESARHALASRSSTQTWEPSSRKRAAVCRADSACASCDQDRVCLSDLAYRLSGTLSQRLTTGDTESHRGTQSKAREAWLQLVFGGWIRRAAIWIEKIRGKNSKIFGIRGLSSFYLAYLLPKP